MRKSFGAKPYLYPMPVLMIATYDENGVPDVMNAAWGGIGDTTQVNLCLSAGHKTVKNILARGAFTVSPAQQGYVTPCDYVGIVSANQVPDKVARAGFTTEKSSSVDAPVIRELAMALECRLVSYDPQTGRLIGEIVDVTIDQSVLDGEGNVDVKKLAPILFDPINNAYWGVGEKVGDAFSQGNALK